MMESDRDLLNFLLAAALTEPEIRQLLLEGSRQQLLARGIPLHLAGLISESGARSIEELASVLLALAPDLDEPRPWRADPELQSAQLEQEPVPIA